MVMGPGCVKKDPSCFSYPWKKNVYRFWKYKFIFVTCIFITDIHVFWCIFIMCCHSKYFAVKKLFYPFTHSLSFNILYSGQYTYSSCHCHRKCSRCINQLKYKVYNLFHILHVHAQHNNFTFKTKHKKHYENMHT